MIWASATLASGMSFPQIGDCSCSDHAFVLMQWKAQVDCYKPRIWHFDNFLLQVSGASDKFRADILEFYSWKKGSAKTTNLWDACKAFLRGKLMSLKAFRDKEKNLASAKLKLEI